MLVSEETRREWGIPSTAWVLPICFLSYAGLQRVRSPQPLTYFERRHLKLVAHCPRGREVYGNREDCVHCLWWTIHQQNTKRVHTTSQKIKALFWVCFSDLSVFLVDSL